MYQSNYHITYRHYGRELWQTFLVLKPLLWSSVRTPSRTVMLQSWTQLCGRRGWGNAKETCERIRGSTVPTCNTSYRCYENEWTCVVYRLKIFAVWAGVSKHWTNSMVSCCQSREIRPLKRGRCQDGVPHVLAQLSIVHLDKIKHF